MDKIDSFIIKGNGAGGKISFRFVLIEENIEEMYRDNIVDYIDNFTRDLNRQIPQFTFVWEEAHRIIPEEIIEEVVHQILIQGGK